MTLDSATNLYVGGHFTMAGDQSARNVARWNPSTQTWTNLGDGVQGTVNGLLADPSGLVYAGGTFTEAGTLSAYHIAAWDPVTGTWTNLGSGVNGEVIALALDAEGNLYVGGAFTSAGGVAANNVARWNPLSLTWTNLGEGMNDAVTTLAVSSNGILYAGGWFTVAGTSTVHYVTQWNGSEWLPMGSGMNDVVTSLAFDGSGRLFAGGLFSTAGSVTARAVAVWNGDSWSGLSLGVSCSVMSLDYDPSSGLMHAAGWISCSAGSGNTLVSSHNGTNWSPFATMNNMITVIRSDRLGGLYAGGLFTEADQNRHCRYIAHSRGNHSDGLGHGFNNTIDALAVDRDGTIYAGGWFHCATDHSNVMHIARWNKDEQQWTGVGGGTHNGVMAMAFGPDHALYVGGFFTNAGNMTANHIAVWNGTTWTNMCKGLNGAVTAVKVDSSGRIYAGGYFTKSGLGCSATHIAQWNGTTWTNLGDGFSPSPYVAVHALAVDSQDHLYAGGSFTNSGGLKVSNVARWDPIDQSWTNLGLGVDQFLEVHALAVDSEDRLYVGGHFTNAGGVAVGHIARWDPVTGTWTNLGSGLNNTVMAIEIDGAGRVFAGGEFMRSGNELTYGVAMWNGTAWTGLGDGVDGNVYAMASGSSDTLYVGGDFWKAGDINAPYIASFTLFDRDDDGLPDWWELFYFGDETIAQRSDLCANGEDSIWSAYVAGIDPNDPMAAIPEPEIMHTADNQIRLYIAATSTGRIYGVIGTTNLLAAPQVWLPVISEQHGSGTAISFDLPGSARLMMLRSRIRLP